MHMPAVSQWPPVAGQVDAGGGDHTSRRIGSLEMTGRPAQRVSVQKPSEASPVDAKNRMTPPRFQRFLLLCRCDWGAACLPLRGQVRSSGGD